MLAKAIVNKRPNILVVSGDLVNNPSWRWPLGKGHWIDVNGWLRDILKQIPDTKVFVLPGNHDALVRGVFGWCWPAVRSFRHVFAEWYRREIYYDPKARVALLTLDTNPRLALYQGAQGKVLRWRLRRLKKALASPQAAEIQTATKILLMHHHPLPAPFQGPDLLLHTRRSDLLLRFLAEHHIDLVLHGHKHRATWSNLRLGGSTTQPFFIEVIGAGAAMKSNDYDCRGHNFNLIDIAPNGVRSVRQFFKEAGAGHFEESTPSEAERQVGDLVQSHFRVLYRMRKISWELDIDEEGDGYNRLVLEGLVFNRSQPDTYDVLLPEDELEEGAEALPYQGEQFLPAELGGKLAAKNLGGGDRAHVTFTTRPTEDRAATARVWNYDLNNYVMDQREAEERGFQNTTRDSIEYYLSEAVDVLCLSVKFPQKFPLAHVQMEVLELVQEPDAVHQRLQSKFGGAFQHVGNVLTASLAEPPANFRYRLSWDIPPAPQIIPKELLAAEARRHRFEDAYLQLLRIPPPAAELADNREDAIARALDRLFRELDLRVRAAMKANDSQLDRARVDLSFIVCDRSQKPHKLRMVFSNQESAYPEFFLKFRLSVGEGNAGRAYKAGTVRAYDREAAKNDPKSHTYKHDASGPMHEFLLSFPLLDPWLKDPFPMGVLSVGTTDPNDAHRMRALDEAALGHITAEIQNEPRTFLLVAAGLHPGVG